MKLLQEFISKWKMEKQLAENVNNILVKYTSLMDELESKLLNNQLNEGEFDNISNLVADITHDLNKDIEQVQKIRRLTTKMYKSKQIDKRKVVNQRRNSVDALNTTIEKTLTLLSKFKKGISSYLDNDGAQRKQPQSRQSPETNNADPLPKADFKKISQRYGSTPVLKLLNRAEDGMKRPSNDYSQKFERDPTKQGDVRKREAQVNKQNEVIDFLINAGLLRELKDRMLKTTRKGKNILQKITLTQQP